MATDTGASLLAALRQAEAELATRREEFAAMGHHLTDRQAGLAAVETASDQASSYNTTIRAQNAVFDAEIARKTALTAALDREIRTKQDLLETLDTRLADVLAEHVATLASVRGELLAAMAP